MVQINYPQIWHPGILNILSWRSLRKWQKQKGHSDFLPLSSFLCETSHKTLTWGTLPMPGRKEHSYLWRQRNAKKNSTKQTVLLPAVYYNHPMLFHTPYSCMTLFFTKPSIKIHRSVSLGLHFLIKVPVSHKTNIKNSFLLIAVDDDIFS